MGVIAVFSGGTRETSGLAKSLLPQSGKNIMHWQIDTGRRRYLTLPTTPQYAKHKSMIAPAMLDVAADSSVQPMQGRFSVQ